VIYSNPYAAPPRTQWLSKLYTVIRPGEHYSPIVSTLCKSWHLAMDAGDEETTPDMKRLTLADVVVTTVETPKSSGDLPPHPPLSLIAPVEDLATKFERESCGVETSASTTSLRPHPLSLPLTTHKIYSVAASRTMLHLQLFSDRTLLTCSQLQNGRIATWLLCKPIISMAPTYQGPSSNRIDLDILPLLGARDSDVVVYTALAKQIYNALQIGQRTIPILLGLGLPHLVANPFEHRELFHTIAHLMSSLYQEALEK
jgi:hypothetical protein